MLQRAWNDNVWSKVIAAGITAGLAAIGALVVKNLERVLAVGSDAATVLASSISVPMWFVLGVAILMATLAASVMLLLWQRRMTTSNECADDQPNAVPVVLIPPRSERAQRR